MSENGNLVRQREAGRLSWIPAAAYWVMAVFSFAWCIIVVGYLLFGGSKLFRTEGIVRLCAAVLTGAAACGSGIALEWIFNQMKWSTKSRLLFLSAAAVGVCILAAVKIPYAPDHDAYDLSIFLDLILRGGESGYMTAYLNANAPNHLTLLVYFPFVKLFGSVWMGSRVCNALLMTGSVFLMAGACGRIYGACAMRRALVVLSFLLPFPLLSGPYIYLPAIFLGSAAFFCYHGKSIGEKIFFVLAGGLLFVLRLTACAFLLVYVFAANLMKKKGIRYFLKSTGVTAGILLCFILIKSVLGFAFYEMKLHPYPNLDSVSAIWTMELGTRPLGDRTGTCSYSPFIEEGEDEISQGFHQLWRLYGRNDRADWPAVQKYKEQLSQAVIQRSKELILKHPQTAWSSLWAKFKNYFADTYKPYYYVPNVNSSDFCKQMYYNFEDGYFLFLNVLILLFSLIGGAILIFSGRAAWKRHGTLCPALNRTAALIFGTVAVQAAAILLMEVGKRLIFDTYVPMLIVICWGNHLFAEFAEKGGKRTKAVFLAASLAAGAGLYGLYRSQYHPVFRGAAVEVTEKEIILRFPERVSIPGYVITQPGKAEVELYGKKEIHLAVEGERNDVFLFQCPDGRWYRVSNMKIY